MQTEKGQSIEDQSMQIIENEIGSHDYSKQEWPIVRRIIHATADFEFSLNSLNNAFTIEDAQGLPPFLPLFVIYGISNAKSASFDSGDDTKPTGIPMIKAGVVTPS